MSSHHCHSAAAHSPTLDTHPLLTGLASNLALDVTSKVEHVAGPSHVTVGGEGPDAPGVLLLCAETSLRRCNAASQNCEVVFLP